MTKSGGTESVQLGVECRGFGSIQLGVRKGLLRDLELPELLWADRRAGAFKITGSCLDRYGGGAMPLRSAARVIAGAIGFIPGGAESTAAERSHVLYASYDMVDATSDHVRGYACRVTESGYVDQGAAFLAVQADVRVLASVWLRHAVL